MLVTLGICFISVIVVCTVASKFNQSESESPFSLGLALWLIFLSPVPYPLYVLILMSNYWG